MVRFSRFVCPIALVAILLGSCASRDAGPIGGPIFNGTTPDGSIVEPPITTLPAPSVDSLRVPAEFFSIQEAVNAAQPGDLIIVDPGVYSEEVVISNPDIILRGRERETVFVDGLHSLGTGISVLADGVAVENLTVRNYTLDGISIGQELVGDMPPVNRSRVGFVTTSNTGRHGIVSQRATQVEITDVWVSGHGGAGVSIQNCSPCDSVIRNSLAEFSARGFALTGTGADTSVTTSTSRNNRIGIVVEDGELASTGAVIAGNLVLNNGFSNSPQIDPALDHAYGAGIHVVGSTSTQIVRNRLAGNIGTGILLGSTPGGPALPIDPTLEGNEFTPHPNGDVIDIAQNQVWSPIVAPSIPYQNGPVPQGSVSMEGADTDPGVPAGAVQQPDLPTLQVPAV